MRNRSLLTTILVLIGMAALILGGPIASMATPIGYSVRSNADDHLYSIDLATGAATDLGLIGFADAEGLAFVGSELYTIGGTVGEFWNITTPPGALVGNTGARNGVDAGLDYDPVTGKMYNVNDGYLYEINIANGLATFIGYNDKFADGMGIASDGTAYVIDGIFTDSLYTVDLTTGSMTLVGGLGFNSSAQFGLSFDNGTLWGLNSLGEIYNFNLGTGNATYIAHVMDASGANINGFEGLAISAVPEPSTLLLFGTGLIGIGVFRRKFKG